jgi:flagellar secretion chaperone FliS
MFGTAKSGANAYAKVGVETGVASASPHKLIVMLFDGALMALNAAQQQMQAGDIPGKGQSISKVISIIDSGLRASLDHKAGGSIAINLDALYEYMSRRLLSANLENNPAILEEVRGLLLDLKGAWETIGDVPQAAPGELPAPALANIDPLAPHTSNLIKA